jgi:hypothetical protein
MLTRTPADKRLAPMLTTIVPLHQQIQRTHHAAGTHGTEQGSRTGQTTGEQAFNP